MSDATAHPIDADAVNQSLSAEAHQGSPSGAHKFVRIAQDGERYLPHRFRDGFYRVANPALGRTKHHAINQIAIREDEIETFLARGFLLRMRGEVSGQVNLISASDIEVLE